MKTDGKAKIRILTWHIHGSYLYYLSKSNCDFYIPYKNKGEEGYAKLSDNFNWGSNVISVPSEKVKEICFDCILFQSKKDYLSEQFKILNEEQRKLPKIYLEHDPPRIHPTDTKHIVNDGRTLIINVTNFNNLMWEFENNITAVIEHGISMKTSKFTGKFKKGIVSVNNLEKRGRRLGFDIFEKVRKEVPLDIIGINSKDIGGLGEIEHKSLGSFLTSYRFFFSPIRYTSLGLSLCEAMYLGLPVIAPATTEVSTVINNGKNGFTSNNIDYLILKMKELLEDVSLAKKLVQAAKRTALKRFNIERFKKDWHDAFSFQLKNILSKNYSAIQ